MRRVLLFTALIVWSAMASAIVYKWADADGRIHYGDRPPDGVKAEVVELLGTHTTSAPPPPPQPPRVSSGTSSAAPSAAAQGAAARDGTQADQSDPAAARAAQCDAARQRLQQLTDGRHLYKPGPNGEREYLTSAQIDTERADAKNEVDQLCGT